MKCFRREATRLSAVVAILLFPLTGQAEEAPLTGPPNPVPQAAPMASSPDLERRIRELEETVRRLQAQLDRYEKAPPSVPAAVSELPSEAPAPQGGQPTEDG